MKVNALRAPYLPFLFLHEASRLNISSSLLYYTPTIHKEKGALALDVINLGANLHDNPRSQVGNFSFVKNFIILRGRTLRALLSVSEGTWK